MQQLIIFDCCFVVFDLSFDKTPDFIFPVLRDGGDRLKFLF